MTGEGAQDPQRPQEAPAGGSGARDPVADVAGEAARLFEALRDAAVTWAEQSARGGAGAAPAEHPAGCTFCPLCAAFRRLQSTRPEVVNQLREVAGTLATALAAFSGGHPDSTPHQGGGPWGEARTGTGNGSGAPRPPSPHERSPRPERIEVWE